MNTLEKARIEINQIDQEMARLFEARLAVVEDVLAYKQANGLAIFDPVREKEVIARNSLLIKNEGYIPYYQNFLQHLMDVSKDYQVALLEKEK